MHAQCLPVCGNLFHHTVEMFLKAGLSQRRKLSDLKCLGHNLGKLWQAFKEDFPDSVLDQHNETMLTVGKFEGIRYPEKTIGEGAVMLANWSSFVGAGVSYSGGMVPETYSVIVDDIDSLVADVFKACSRNPAVFIGTGLAVREAITRNNAHAEFLTKQLSPIGLPSSYKG